MTQLTFAHLEEGFDFNASREIVTEVVERALETPPDLITFLGRYAAWNSLFGAGVAQLSAKIGRSRDLFMDPESPLKAIADRSVLVASFFFDAARDKFDDSKTEHRDSQRCLSQATLWGALRYFRQDGCEGNETIKNNAAVDALLEPPMWLNMLMHRVDLGYGGSSADALPCIARAMGYHLGSEVLADQEFGIIDSTWRRVRPELVAYLQSCEIEIAGQKHNAYAWPRIHTPAEPGSQAKHFERVMQGIEAAFRYSPKDQHDSIRHQVLLGFRDFAVDHAEFFAEVLGA